MIQSLIKRYIRAKVLYSNSELDIRKAFGYISNNKIKGDYVEFGVFDGCSLKAACEFAGKFKVENMNFYGFDSFEGLPKTEQKETPLVEGDYYCSLDNVKRNMKKYPNVKLVKGWFNKVKIPKEIKEIAIVNIDCDFYEGARDALKLIKPFVKEGMVIRFDDWFLFKGRPDRGEQKAFNEFKKTVKNYYFVEFFSNGGTKTFVTLKK